MSHDIHQVRAAKVATAMRSAAAQMPAGAAGAAWALASGPRLHRHVTVDVAGPLSADSLFLASSVTKVVAAALVHGLIEDGALGLDEPLDRYVPEWTGRRVLRTPVGPLEDTVPAERPLTVRDLLLMGLGLGYGSAAQAGSPLTAASASAGIMSSWVVPEPDPDEWVRRVATLPSAHQPGAGYLYQSSFDALTVVVERATGRGFDVVLRERLLDPLGMSDTGYTVDPDDLGRVPAHHFPGDGPDGGATVEVVPAGDAGLQRRRSFCSAATGLITTVGDLISFGQMLLDGGVAPGGRILTEASVAAMRTDALADTAREAATEMVGPGGGWGLGCGIDAGGRFGWDGGTGTSLWIDPDAEVAGVLLTRLGMGGAAEPPTHMATFWEAVRSGPWR